jgi:hypothetical protein
LQQSALVQTLGGHLVPLVQLVQVALRGFTFFASPFTLAITVAAAKDNANALTIIFFIC